ncbi:MAG: AAA family ATPase [Verrucomicrobia bacterium]|nr:AAA family ATPase [Verrucomicrobiota bacterium]
MKIDKIEIKNFKRFEKQTLELHPQFTLLVGDNGAGKTTLLDALAVAAAVWLVKVPDSTLASSGRNILSNEIRLDPKKEGDRIQFNECKPVAVLATGQIAGRDVQWCRQIRKEGARTTNADAKEALAIIADVFIRVAGGDKVLCPVIAYYGAGRSWLPSQQRSPKGKVNGPARRWEAFYECFEERIRLSDLQDWFQREVIAFVNRGGTWRPGYEVVKMAILRCIPESNDLWYDGDRAEIVLSIDGRAQPFSLLSAGQRMMVALIADIAIKAVTQNAFLLPADQLGPDDRPWPRILRETPGLVLIDEVDVHLHPKWQRRVVGDLKETFPSMQFVATTHSPQVIGAVPADEIRLISQTGEITQPMISMGVDSNWILDHIMPDAESRDAETRKLLDDIEEALDEDNLTVAEKKLREAHERIQGSNGELTRLTAVQNNKSNN